MLPTIAFPVLSITAQPATPVNQAVIAPVPAQAAPSLVAQSVPANVAAAPLFNQVRSGSAAQPLEGRSEEVVAQAFQRDTQLRAARSGKITQFGFSTPFLAQAMSQEKVANDNESAYRQFETPKEERTQRSAANDNAAGSVLSIPDAFLRTAQHLSSLQRVSIKAYQSTVARNTLSLNPQTLLHIVRSA